MLPTQQEIDHYSFRAMRVLGAYIGVAILIAVYFFVQWLLN